MTTTFKQQADVVKKLYNNGSTNIHGALKMRGKFTLEEIKALNDAASSLAAMAINTYVDALEKESPMVETLAKEFSAKLEEWIGEELKTVVARNYVEKDSAICHSHDFCDANMAMIEVFEARGLDWETHNELLDAAWNKAKANNFYTI